MMEDFKQKEGLKPRIMGNKIGMIKMEIITVVIIMNRCIKTWMTIIIKKSLICTKDIIAESKDR